MSQQCAANSQSVSPYLQLNEAGRVLLVVQAAIILERGNLLIIQAVWRFPAHHNHVALQACRRCGKEQAL